MSTDGTQDPSERAVDPWPALLADQTRRHVAIGEAYVNRLKRQNWWFAMVMSIMMLAFLTACLILVV